MTFKTNLTAPDSAMAIEKELQKKFPDAKLSLDVDSADKVLHVHGIPAGEENAALVERNIEEAGFKGAWLEREVNNK